MVGSGGADRAAEALSRSLADDVPVVVDADALRHVEPGHGRELVLTPHAGELAEMLGVDRADVEARQLEHARRAASELGAVVLLKGRHSLTAAPDGRVRGHHQWHAVAGGRRVR